MDEGVRDLHDGCAHRRRCINGAWCERLEEYVEHRQRCGHYETARAEGERPTAKV